MASPLLDVVGAVPADGGFDVGVAAHYGDPLREQKSLAAGAGFVDLSHRGVVRISGPDRLTWLHSISTQKLDALKPFVGADALILSPQGHVEHHLQLVDDGEAVWIHVEPTDVAPLLAFLASMRFMLRVEVEDVTADWAIVWEPVLERHPTLLSRVDPVADAVAGRQVFVPRSELGGFATAGDRTGPPAGVQALEALRVEAGRPRFGVDTDHRTIPHEVGWIGKAVVLDKGCYRGQETVARVANLGRPPRRLVRLHLDGSVREGLPAHAADVAVDDTSVGHVTTTAYHYELGPISLALLKYSTSDDATAVVEIGGVPVHATIEGIVELDTSPRPGAAARAAFRLK